MVLAASELLTGASWPDFGLLLAHAAVSNKQTVIKRMPPS
jgi:hypothetical protein